MTYVFTGKGILRTFWPMQNYTQQKKSFCRYATTEFTIEIVKNEIVLRIGNVENFAEKSHFRHVS